MQSLNGFVKETIRNNLASDLAGLPVNKVTPPSYEDRSGIPASEPSLPLDAFQSSLEAAYALKKVISDYSGPLVRVINSATLQSKDIYPNSSGSIDLKTLNAFLGASGASGPSNVEQVPLPTDVLLFSGNGISDCTGKHSVVKNTATLTTRLPFAGPVLTSQKAATFSSTNYIEYANAPDLVFGANDFTLQAIFIVVGAAQTSCILSKFTSWPTSVGFYLNITPYQSGYKLRFRAGNNLICDITSTDLIEAELLTHVAVQRRGNDIRMYINGKLTASFSGSLNLTDTATLRMGFAHDASEAATNVYVSGVKITNKAEFDLNFTPPEYFTPYKEIDQYSNYLTCHLDFENGTPVDLTGNCVITTTGTTDNTTAKFLTMSGNLSSTSQLTISNTPNLSISYGSEFTFELLFYLTSTSSDQVLFANYNSSVNLENTMYLIYRTSGSKLEFAVNQNWTTGQVLSSSNSPQLGWNHVECSYSLVNGFNIILNGVNTNTPCTLTAFNPYTSNHYFGRFYGISNTAQAVANNIKIQQFKFYKGIAKNTGNIALTSNPQYANPTTPNRQEYSPIQKPVDSYVSVWYDQSGNNNHLFQSSIQNMFYITYMGYYLGQLACGRSTSDTYSSSASLISRNRLKSAGSSRCYITEASWGNSIFYHNGGYPLSVTGYNPALFGEINKAFGLNNNYYNKTQIAVDYHIGAAQPRVRVLDGTNSITTANYYSVGMTSFNNSVLFDRSFRKMVMSVANNGILYSDFLNLRNGVTWNSTSNFVESNSTLLQGSAIGGHNLCLGNIGDGVTKCPGPAFKSFVVLNCIPSDTDLTLIQSSI
jgi:hypothetical protein